MKKYEKICCKYFLDNWDFFDFAFGHSAVFPSEMYYLQTVFQVLGANIVIHLGFVFLNRSEMKNAILEMFLHIMLIIITLYIFGLIFQWFTSTPMWILVIMAIIIYIVSVIVNVLYMGQEAREIQYTAQKEKR